MKTGIKNQTLAFAFLECFFWAGYCCVLGFISSYLKQLNYSDSIIGLIMAVVAMILMITQPLFGYLADSYIPPKILISLSILISIGLAFLIPLAKQGFVYALITVLLLTVCESSVTGVISSWSSKLIAAGEPINYGLTRGTGSMGFAFTAILVGFMMQKLGSDIIFILHAGFYTLDILVILFLVKYIPCLNKKVHNEKQLQSSSGLINSIGILMRNKRYVVLMLSIFITSCSITMVNTYFPIILLSAGGTSEDVGIYLFVTAMSEGCVMIFYSKFAKRFKNRSLFLFSLFFFVIRFLLFWAASGNTTALIVFQITQSFSYGLYLPSTVAYTAEVSPLALRSTALSIGMALNMGLSSVIGNLVGSILSQNISLLSIFPVALLLVIISILIFSITFLIKDAPVQN
ncbi:MFS transporter [Acetanaerobacterium elongatum]|uniref:MFS_1 like family protein n=1 Tax=Acetanaerobacterium elongatum TaxID=258515 RepID=A0A1H0BEM4_9FIRM|nr:MFS transporter [Acetanaerobacterium elongatum]SDN44051.1 MFS_1 like family protein [Acetanaerobacterium elongatum]